MSGYKHDKEQFEKYLSGKMSNEEAHRFEKEVLKDPFAQEALEGMEAHEPELILSDIEGLQQKVLGQQQAGLPWLKIAAVVALLIVGSFTVWLLIAPLPEQTEVAMETDQTEETIEKNEPESATDEELKLDEDSEPAPAEIEDSEPVVTIDLDQRIAENESIPEPEVVNEIASKPANLSVAAATEVEEDVPPLKLNNGSGSIQGRVKGPDMPSKLSIAKEDIDPEEGLVSKDVQFDQVEAQAPAISALTEAINDEELQGGFGDDDAVFFMEATDSISVVEKAKSAPSIARLNATGAVSRSRATNNTVYGTITDESGEALPGVNINVKGSVSGTISDINGLYALEAAPGTTLVVSFVGFESMEIEVGDQELLNLQLDNQTSVLSEVVVTQAIPDSRPSSAASPMDGNKSYQEYIRENLIYPAAAKSNNIEGTVVLELTISTTGEVSNIDVKKSLGFGCDTEAIRLIKEGPKWSPAERDGINKEDKVRVRIRFKL